MTSDEVKSQKSKVLHGRGDGLGASFKFQVSRITSLLTQPQRHKGEFIRQKMLIAFDTEC